MPEHACTLTFPRHSSPHEFIVASRPPVVGVHERCAMVTGGGEEGGGRGRFVETSSGFLEKGGAAVAVETSSGLLLEKGGRDVVFETSSGLLEEGGSGVAVETSSGLLEKDSGGVVFEASSGLLMVVESKETMILESEDEVLLFRGLKVGPATATVMRLS